MVHFRLQLIKQVVNTQGHPLLGPLPDPHTRTPQAAHTATASAAGEIDVAFHLPIDTLPDLREKKCVSARSFEVTYHLYMAFHNMDRLSLKVRKAIDLAIDRDALSQSLAGGHGTRSLFPDNTPFYSDDSKSHGDADAAKTLLDEAGWACQ